MQRSAFPHSPGRLLSQNGELRPLGVFNWTIPAWSFKRADGTRFNTCPSAGRCTRVCYALYGKYLFSPVRARHLANFEFLLNHPREWRDQMLTETGAERFFATGQMHTMAPGRTDMLDHDPADTFLHEWVMEGGRAVRIHDAGDFFAEWYLDLWADIARARPHILFYAYTKEVPLAMRYMDEGLLPPNLRIILSFGGIHDKLIDRDKYRHADVFPNAKACEEAGYYNQEINDLLAVTAPTTRIGVLANNIPATKKIFDGRTMSELAVPGKDLRLTMPETTPVEAPTAVPVTIQPLSDARVAAD